MTSQNLVGCTHFLHRLFFALAFVVLCVSAGNAQKFNQDPGHKEYLSIGGVRFSSPNGFDAQRLKTKMNVTYVPHNKYDLGLFVALPDKAVDSEYIKQLASFAASSLFPKGQAEYSWKRLNGYQKVSKYEVGGSMVQGFDGQQRVLVQFRRLRVNGKEVIAGYTFGLGRGEQAKQLFEQNLGGDSMPGWYAQAHIIASLTGEKYEEINPGTSLIAAPPPAARKN